MIKAQVLADFIAEFSYQRANNPNREEMGTLEPQWKLYVDGSSNEHRAGARVILISPKGHRTHYALRLGFKASNN